MTSPKQLTDDWIEIARPEESLPLFLAKCLEDHFDRNKERLDTPLQVVSGRRFFGRGFGHPWQRPARDEPLDERPKQNAAPVGPGQAGNARRINF